MLAESSMVVLGMNSYLQCELSFAQCFLHNAFLQPRAVLRQMCQVCSVRIQSNLDSNSSLVPMMLENQIRGSTFLRREDTNHRSLAAPALGKATIGRRSSGSISRSNGAIL